MPEWNQSPGGLQSSLDDWLEKIRLKLEGFKGGPVLILAAVLGVVIVLWTAWFTVQPEETGIVQRFGKVMRTAGPGLHFKLPFGVEKVRLLPTVRVLKEEFGFPDGIATGINLDSGFFSKAARHIYTFREAAFLKKKN